MRSVRHAFFLFAIASSTAFGQATPSNDPLAGKSRLPQRQPVTPELERTAFLDPRARTLFHRARAARLSQDSTLQSYEVKTLQRLTIGLKVRNLGVSRTLMRAENAALVRWSRSAGLWIEPTGRRAVAPMAREATVGMDLTAATPLPYYPGREALWLPSSYVSPAKAEVDEKDLLHPLATGAEAYYRYETGDSMSIRLPGGQTIALRELKITARRPDWRAFVGSFWFDVESGYLVRAVYRLSTEVDLFEQMDDEKRREIAELEEIVRTDTGKVAQRARQALDSGAVHGISAIVKGIVSTMRGNISAITVEYGLHNGRFWLPRLHVAEGEVQVGFMRFPVRIDESFRYATVNADVEIPVVPTRAELGLADGDSVWGARLQVGSAPQKSLADSLRDRFRAPIDSAIAHDQAIEERVMLALKARADSLRQRADSARASGDTVLARRLQRSARLVEASASEEGRRVEGCKTDSSYVATVRSRYQGQLRVAVRMPCDTMRLVNSPDLPPSIYEPAEDLFGSGEERDKFLESLGLSLQSGWGPRPLKFHMGLDMVRYNRIEGLSVGGSATSHLGFGYSVGAEARFGVADRVPNGELWLARANGRSTVRLAAFQRLAVANDDRGAPLSFGASLSNLVFGRDEGFYYRALGAELAGVRDAPSVAGSSTLLWRAFIEQQRSAGVAPKSQISLAHLFSDRAFGLNIDARRLTAFGVAADLGRSFGMDPTAFRLNARTRVEAALVRPSDTTGTMNYQRVVLDLTASRAFGPLALSITGVAGAGAGELTPQRAFYVGGANTVRGLSAYPFGEGYVGNSMWLTRSEVGLSTVWARPILFYDAGWAGNRDDFAHPGRPLSGAGIGLSFLDGLVRTDVSRGIWPEKGWRLDLYLDSLF